MSIVTKKGDKGMTSLYRGKRVSKAHIRIEACGAIDELSSYLGLSKSMIKNRKMANIIESIQKDLFILCSEIVTEVKALKKLKKRINGSFVDRLDKTIRNLEEKRSLKIKCFQLPGANSVSSVLDISRTITRRAERRVTILRRKRLLSNKHILSYLNRLSDLLYLIARSSEGSLNLTK